MPGLAEGLPRLRRTRSAKARTGREAGPNGPCKPGISAIPGQLNLLGLRGSDINYVDNSHYHFDLCGGNRHRHEATTICHVCGLAAARAHYPFEAFPYGDRTLDGAPVVEPEIEI